MEARPSAQLGARTDPPPRRRSADPTVCLNDLINRPQKGGDMSTSQVAATAGGDEIPAGSFHM